MRIIIAGAGVIGANLARYLTQENHEVYLLEVNEEIARQVDEKLDVKTVIGSASDPQVLKRVGVDQADLVIAVTASDETNLVVSSLAALFGAKRRIARVRNTSLGETLAREAECFKVNEIINPEEVAAQSIIQITQTPGTKEVADFADGRLFLRSFEVSASSVLCNMRIEDLNDEDFPWPFLITAIIRNGSVVMPAGGTVIQEGDLIYVLLPAGSLGEFLTFVDPNSRLPKKAVIYGATNIGEKVAQGLEGKIKDLTILEESPVIAEDVAGRLKSARVINGSGAESDILKEAGIEAADVFVAVSDNDHSNLVSAVLAKKMGAKHTVITTQHPDYMAIVDALDIDVIINPRLLAVDQILRLVRGKGIQSVTKLMECDAEALEFVPEAGSPITKAPLKDITLPKNSIIGAVYSGDEISLANGDTQLKEGQRVIVFSQGSAVKKLQHLFTRHKLF